MRYDWLSNYFAILKIGWPVKVIVKFQRNIPIRKVYNAFLIVSTTCIQWILWFGVQVFPQSAKVPHMWTLKDQVKHFMLKFEL